MGDINTKSLLKKFSNDGILLNHKMADVELPNTLFL